MPRRTADSRIVTEISNILAYLGYPLLRPEKKFLNQLVFGILCSQSALLSEIARAIRADSKVKTVWDRLDMNLGKFDLSLAYERAQKLMCLKVSQSHLFIFDPSEVVKPFAEKMEGLQLVRDASEKPRLVKDSKTGKIKEQPVLKPGYPVRVAIAVSPKGDVIPLELSLYSCASENFLSRNEEYIQVLDPLLHRTQFLPILVLDREFDGFWAFRHLMGLRQKFIIRLTRTRRFHDPHDPYNHHQKNYTREQIIGKKAYLSTYSVITYSRDGKSKTQLFEFKAAHVRLLSEIKGDDTFREEGDHEALTLVEMKIQKESGVPTIYLLTNTRPKTDTELENIGRSYLARWNVEEYIRFLKQHFDLEGFLVRDLGRMKNLMQAVYIATVILHLLTDQESLKGIRNHHHLIDKALEVNPNKLGRDFFLYAYGRGIKNVVRLNKTLLKTFNTALKKSPKKSRKQMRFRVLD